MVVAVPARGSRPRTRPSRLRWLPAVVVLLLLAGACGGGGSSAPSPSGSTVPGTLASARYYLSLGDSLAFGVQKTTAEAAGPSPIPATPFDKGYTNDIAAQLQAQNPGITVTNLGCPGETSSSFLAGPCDYRTKAQGLLHTDYTGSQLSAATLALTRDGGNGGLITLSLGGNDVNALLAQCPTVDPACLSPLITPAAAQLRTNLTRILQQLRSAAPSAIIVLVAPYNPYYALSPQSDALVQPFLQAAVAAAADTHVLLANAFSDFNSGGSPGGPTGTERDRICSLTNFCKNGDIHASDAGYAEMARLILATVRQAGAPGTSSP